MVWGDAVSKLETFVWILSHISRTITWSLFILKAPYLVKWSILPRSFMWWCQFIDWLKFETHPSSLLNFGMAYLHDLVFGLDFRKWWRHVQAKSLFIFVCLFLFCLYFVLVFAFVSLISMVAVVFISLLILLFS